MKGIGINREIEMGIARERASLRETDRQTERHRERYRNIKLNW